MTRDKELHCLLKMFTVQRKIWMLEWNKSNSLGLSLTHVTILNILEKEGPKQAKDLVDNLFISSGGVTGVTNKLVEAGHILRKRDETGDRRSVIFEITDQGRQVIEKANEKKEQLMKKFYRSLSNSEVNDLYIIYRKLLKDLHGKDFQSE